MRNLLLDSVRHFYQNDFQKSITAVNAHFVEKFGSDIININRVTVGEFSDSDDWTFYIYRLIDAYWTKKVRIGLIYREIWDVYPSQTVLWIISHIDLSSYTLYLSRQSDEAFDSLRLFELIDILREGCRTGKILREENEMPYGNMPIILDFYFESLEEQQYNDFYATKLRTAIQQGLDERPSNYLELLPELHYEFIAKHFLKEFYIPKNEINFIRIRLKYFYERFPSRVKVVSKALRKFMDSIQGDDELADFIFLYTGGEVLPPEPRVWFEAFIQSVETGSLKLPSERD